MTVFEMRAILAEMDPDISIVFGATFGSVFPVDIAEEFEGTCVLSSKDFIPTEAFEDQPELPFEDLLVHEAEYDEEDPYVD